MDRAAQFGWVLWLIFGVSLIIMGIEGSLGKVLACVLCPVIVELNS